MLISIQDLLVCTPNHVLNVDLFSFLLWLTGFFFGVFHLENLNKLLYFYAQMQAYQKIQQKLQGFIRKYYTNELIKGIILFISFGLLYFLFTLLIEHFLWLKPRARTILFWVFVLVELGLLVRYIFFPIFKLIGISKGISLDKASQIIGVHFKEIDDKLLNMLQLHREASQSELVLASIDQKAANLQPIPFQKAIQFSTNKKYLKYLAIPLLVWLFTLLGGKKMRLQDSYKRVVNHQQLYLPPAPFKFEIKNPTLKVIEGQGIKLEIETHGDFAPEKAKILFGDEDYFLSIQGVGQFTYQINHINQNTSFYLKANEVTSIKYLIEVIPTPKIQAINLLLNYPNHVNKQNEKIANTGNVIVPAGTSITWQIQTQQTDSLKLATNEASFSFERKENSLFKLTKNVRKSFGYSIQASNQYLENYENLSFAIEVVQDAYPEIKIQTDIDSITRGDAQFIGRLTDDYALSKLHLVYFDQQNKENKKRHTIAIKKSSLVDFYYVFPSGLDLIDGVNYEFYFEAFDNDYVSGPKSVKSQNYSYHKDTENEEKEKLLQEQKQGLDDLKKTLEKQEKNRLSLEELQKKLQNKSEVEFNDTKKLEKFIKKQEEYQQMMQRQTEQLQHNLEEQPQSKNESLEEKKEDLKKRMEETKAMEKQEKLLEELRKMAEKLNKEEMIDKIKKMSSNNKQKEKSLAQLLELTKRFYVEQKAEQITEKLQELAKKQEKLADSEENTPKKQEKLNEEFKNIQKDMQDLQKENKELKEPMDIDPQEPEQESVKEDQKDAKEQLEQQQKEQAGKKQKSAAKKMKEMAKSMSLQMAGNSQEMMTEDIAMLRQIIENLITFSYRQEDLMITLSDMHKNHPSFSKKIKEQNTLRTFFEHIDDSLYVLAMRQPKISKTINTYLGEAHYYLEESLFHYAEFEIDKAVSDQHYIMKAANDLALMLSQMLDNMQSAMGMGQGQGKGMGMGQGKGKGSGKGFSLPDIIKKQGELSEKAKKGKEKGEKPGEEKEGKKGKEGEKGEKGKKGKGKKGQNGEGEGGQGNGEQNSQELYDIYKQQAMLRQAIEDQLKDLQGAGVKAQANRIKKQMEDLERLLLEKGITNQVLEKMLRLDHELLKLEKAAQKQGKENKRESKTNRQIYPKMSPKQLEFKNKYDQQNEILNREVLPLRSLYKKKVQEYFKNEE